MYELGSNQTAAAPERLATTTTTTTTTTTCTRTTATRAVVLLPMIPVPGEGGTAAALQKDEEPKAEARPSILFPTCRTLLEMQNIRDPLRRRDPPKSSSPFRIVLKNPQVHVK